MTPDYESEKLLQPIKDKIPGLAVKGCKTVPCNIQKCLHLQDHHAFYVDSMTIFKQIDPSHCMMFEAKANNFRKNAMYWQHNHYLLTICGVIHKTCLQN